jgi:phage baseplate assembly protein W
MSFDNWDYSGDTWDNAGDTWDVTATPTPPLAITTSVPGLARPGFAVPGMAMAPEVPTPPPPPPDASVAVFYATPVVPHLAFPLVIGPSGSWDVVAQDTAAEVAQSVGVLLGTVVGERTMVPAYGVVDPTFATANVSEIVQAISQWEPRADATVSVSTDGLGAESINVAVALVAGGS